MGIKNIHMLLLAALLTTFTPCRAGQPSQLSFGETEWDFGTISEDDGPVSHVFMFINRGSTPITIDRIETSCGCTTPEYTRRPVAPGAEARVKVSFDPTGYSSNFTKLVYVVSGGGKSTDQLTIRGRVTPRVKTVEEEYPHDIGNGLRLDNTTLLFGTIAQGQTASMAIGWANLSDRPLALYFTFIAGRRSGRLTFDAPETACAGCRGVITATYDLTGSPGSYGVLDDLVIIEAGGVREGPRKMISATAIGVDDFSESDLTRAPRFFLDTQFHNFGEVRRRRIPYHFRLTASNEGSETLHIRSVGEKPGLKTTLRGGMTIAPGDELPFEIILFSNRYGYGAVNINESLIMVVDDPLRPVREIRISAKIR